MNRTALFGLVLVMAGCSTASTSRFPTAPATSPPRMVLPHAAVDAEYVLPAAAIEVDGVLHLWIVGFTEGEAPRTVHLTSADARDWEAGATGSEFDPGLAFDANGPVPSSVLVDADGTWRMFGGGRLDDSTPILWTATAPGPNGPWSFVDEPILQPEGVGWDATITDHPSVVRTDDRYLMAYGGAGNPDSNRNRIGFARSADGLVWERVPATLAGADDDLALGPAACGIEARTMVEPELRATDAGLRLDFGAIGVGADEMVIGTAGSADGSSWTCGVSGPVFGAADVDGTRTLHSYLGLALGGRAYFLVELLAPDSESSDLWLVER